MKKIIIITISILLIGGIVFYLKKDNSKSNINENTNTKTSSEIDANNVIDLTPNMGDIYAEEGKPNPDIEIIDEAQEAFATE